MNKKIFISIITLFALTAILLSSCANIDPDGGSGENDGISENEISGDIENSLPDYNGFSDCITIATTDTSPFVAYEDTAGTLAVAIEERNELLADKYSVEIKTSYYTEDQVLSEISASGLSGLRFADLYCFSADVTMQLDAAGELCDISTLPDYGAIKSTAGGTEMITGVGGVCAIAHSSTLFQQSAYCVFYNKQLIKSAGLVDPAVAYVENKWTYDMFLQYSHTIAAEIMNKGSIDYESDTFGYCFADNSETLTRVLWHSQGERLTSSLGCEVTPKEDLEAQKTVLSTLHGVYDDRSRYANDGSKAAELFKSGRCGMLIYKLDYCKALEDGDIDYGIVPLPGGKGYVGGDALVYSLSKDADLEYSSALIFSLLISSGESFKQALCDSYTLLYSRNNATTVMINRIISSAGFNNEYLLCDVSDAYKTFIRDNIYAAITAGKEIYVPSDPSEE